MPERTPELGKAERQYLERHAEPEAACATELARANAPYPAVVAIPAYGEGDSLGTTLASIPRCGGQKPLVILVVNQRDDSPEWAQDANRRILEQLRRDGSCRVLGPSVEHLSGEEQEIVLIDRSASGQRFPPRQGVGLARKIGADFALSLWASGGSQSPWIHCTDADVTLPQDYLDRVPAAVRDGGDRANPEGERAAAAFVYDFVHASDGARDNGAAILEYEIFLRYYVLGLRSAGSAYAYHSIGSTLAIHSRAYAQVRGFPRREAAEDFHLLAKLVKVGRILPLRGEPIVLSGRESTRVPFGTGHAVAASNARAQRGEPFPAYDPRNFTWLRVWLDTLRSLADEPTTPVPELLEFHARPSGVDATVLEALLDRSGASESAHNVAHDQPDITRSSNENFDALGTLRLIHSLRDEVHPDVPLARALEQASFIDHDPAASLEAQRSQLAALEAGSC
jgi:glycosyltransferase involved in cell wall biosynthesis